MRAPQTILRARGLHAIPPPAARTALLFMQATRSLARPYARSPRANPTAARPVRIFSFISFSTALPRANYLSLLARFSLGGEKRRVLPEIQRLFRKTVRA